MKLSRLTFALVIVISTQSFAADGVTFWLQSSLSRIYPNTPRPEELTIQLLAARNSRISFQAAARNLGTRRENVACVVTCADPDIRIQIRRVGYVPVRHLTI